jgi:DNA-binding NarL/FixJ family response regulator
MKKYRWLVKQQVGRRQSSQAQFLSPNVVLMDIKLPDMDGVTVTRRIKEKSPDVNILILTLGEDGFVSQAIEAGASGYLNNVNHEKLIQAIHTVHEGNSWLDTSLTLSILTGVAALTSLVRSGGTRAI